MHDLAGNAAMANHLSLLDMVAQADMVVKIVIGVLLLASIFSWTIIFQKLISIRSQIKRANAFEEALWSGKVIDDLYEQVKNQNDNLMGNIFISAVKEFRSNKSYKDSKEHIYQSMHVEYSRAVDSLEKNIGFLATVGSSAPFIGLFGTVWGIMSGFQAITLSQNTSLAVVAPSIAEALLATAIGLIVAIPATIFYNKFIITINSFSNRLSNFISEFGSLLAKEIE